MPSKIDRIYRNVHENVDGDVYETLRENCGETDIIKLMSELERTCEEENPPATIRKNSITHRFAN